MRASLMLSKRPQNIPFHCKLQERILVSVLRGKKLHCLRLAGNTVIEMVYYSNSSANVLKKKKKKRKLITCFVCSKTRYINVG